jgi:outer membrane protein TolC
MRSLYKLSIALLLFAVQLNTRAQATRDSVIDPLIDIEEILPPLDSLMQIGLRNNALQKLEMAQADAYRWNIHYVKRLWTQGLGVFFNYTDGNLPYFVGNLQSTIPVPQPGQPTTQSVIFNGFKYGVNISLTAFDYLGYKGRVNQAKAQLLVAKHKKDVEAQLFKQSVADIYTNMVGWQKIFKSRNEDLFVQQIACAVAEKEFKEGSIHIAEYARQKNILAIAIAAKEDSEKYYINYYERLQVILNVKLASLKRK